MAGNGVNTAIGDGVKAVNVDEVKTGDGGKTVACVRVAGCTSGGRVATTGEAVANCL